MARKLFPALALFACLASSASADLRFENPVIKLGEVPGGPDLSRKVALTNHSTEKLEILDIERGCSCLQAVPETRLLLPGQSSSVTLSLRTLGHKDGPYSWPVRVRYRAGAQVKEAAFRVEAVIRNEVTLDPADLVMYVTDRVTQEVVLTDLRATPFRVTRFHANLPGLTIDAKEVKPGVQRISVQAEASLIPPGKHEGTLSIYTSDPFYSHLTLPIRLMRFKAAPVQAVPDRVRVDSGVLRTSLVRLRTPDDKALVVRHAECPGLKCTWASNPSGGAVLRLAIEEGKTPPADAVLRVTFEDPTHRLDIPVVRD